MFILVAMVALAVSTSTAQKINVAAHQAKLEKSNAEIANPKKASKAATWYNRGKICVDALVEPTKSLFAGLDESMLTISIGANPSEKSEGIYKFDFVTVYVKGGKVVAWSVDKEVLPNAYETAQEAFAKAS